MCVCVSMLGCVRVSVLGCVCVGVLGCAWVCLGVLGCVRVTWVYEIERLSALKGSHKCMTTVVQVALS